MAEKGKENIFGMHESDESVYSRFLNEKNENDLRLLFLKYKDSLILFLMGYVNNIDDAEELMLDTFAVAASGTTPFSGRSSFKTWLFGIARNQAGTFLRKQKRMVYVPEEAYLDSMIYTEDLAELAAIQKEEKRQLYRALETLPEDYRQALYLLYFEEMSREEVCAVMKKTKKQLYHLAERGRKALKDALERLGFDYAKYR